MYTRRPPRKGSFAKAYPTMAALRTINVVEDTLTMTLLRKARSHGFATNASVPVNNQMYDRRVRREGMNTLFT